MFKFNNKDARRRSGIFIVNFEHVIAGWEVIYERSFLTCSIVSVCF